MKSPLISNCVRFYYNSEVYSLRTELTRFLYRMKLYNE